MRAASRRVAVTSPKAIFRIESELTSVLGLSAGSTKSGVSWPKLEECSKVRSSGAYPSIFFARRSRHCVVSVFFIDKSQIIVIIMASSLNVDVMG